MSEMDTGIISSFFSEPGRPNRTSDVYSGGNGVYIVEMYEGQDLREERVIEGHSLQYAEDCAENWVLGVIK